MIFLLCKQQNNERPPRGILPDFTNFSSAPMCIVPRISTAKYCEHRGCQQNHRNSQHQEKLTFFSERVPFPACGYENHHMRKKWQESCTGSRRAGGNSLHFQNARAGRFERGSGNSAGTIAISPMAQYNNWQYGFHSHICTVVMPKKISAGRNKVRGMDLYDQRCIHTAPWLPLQFHMA